MDEFIQTIHEERHINVYLKCMDFKKKGNIILGCFKHVLKSFEITMIHGHNQEHSHKVYDFTKFNHKISNFNLKPLFDAKFGFSHLK
jgi:hypothetical protein